MESDCRKKSSTYTILTGITFQYFGECMDECYVSLLNAALHGLTLYSQVELRVPSMLLGHLHRYVYLWHTVLFVVIYAHCKQWYPYCLFLTDAVDSATVTAILDSEFELLGQPVPDSQSANTTVFVKPAIFTESCVSKVSIR